MGENFFGENLVFYTKVTIESIARLSRGVLDYNNPLPGCFTHLCQQMLGEAGYAFANVKSPHMDHGLQSVFLAAFGNAKYYGSESFYKTLGCYIYNPLLLSHILIDNSALGLKFLGQLLPNSYIVNPKGKEPSVLLDFFQQINEANPELTRAILTEIIKPA